MDHTNTTGYGALKKKDVQMLTSDNPRWPLLLLLLALPVIGCDSTDPAPSAETPAQPAPEAVADDAAADEDPEGRWRRAPKREVTDEQLAQLQAIGYLEGYEPAPDVTGITRYDKPKAFDGYNIYVSGHANEATLIDMSGRVLHTWSHEFAAAFPQASLIRRLSPTP